jgi:hypothetical protein
MIASDVTKGREHGFWVLRLFCLMMPLHDKRLVS